MLQCDTSFRGRPLPLRCEGIHLQAKNNLNKVKLASS
jgi:hypothetical protein